MGRRSKQAFLKKIKIQVTKKHMKRWLALQIIRKIQIKTIVRYHLTLVIMTIIKKSTNNKCWRGCGEKGILLHCQWGYKLVQQPWRIVQRFLRKLKTKLLYDLEISLLDTYPEKALIQIDKIHPRVHCSTVYKSQDMEAI